MTSDTEQYVEAVARAMWDWRSKEFGENLANSFLPYEELPEACRESLYAEASAALSATPIGALTEERDAASKLAILFKALLDDANEEARELRDALQRLESANDALCAKRSRETYLAMIDNDKCTDELEELDAARRDARSALSANKEERE